MAFSVSRDKMVVIIGADPKGGITIGMVLRQAGVGCIQAAEKGQVFHYLYGIFISPQTSAKADETPLKTAVFLPHEYKINPRPSP